tara:strand:+ start:96 stop:308 length:213 start_codon:yes stop_codon:yes gene_type:complete
MKTIIFMRLSQGVNRFRILIRSIYGINKNMLTRELKELKTHKIINRKIFVESSPINTSFATAPHSKKEKV